MRNFTRTSKLAIWSRRFGSFALPIAIIPVWMHRTQMLNSETFQILLMSAVTLALLAVFIGIAAYFRLWQTGDHGWGKSTTGIFLGLICLSPLAYGASLALKYPFSNDVSSDVQRPPEMLANLQTALRTALPQDETAVFFPAISTRIYEVGPVDLFEMVEELVRERDWEIRIQRKPGTNSIGTINAMATTFLGWRDEVAIRLEPNLAGTRLDMRSASLNGAHDLGANGLRIEKFLTDLDGIILEIKEAETQEEEAQNSPDADAPVADPH